MTMPRIFVATKLESKQEITLDISASNHLLQVLRLKVNDSLIVFNDGKGEYVAIITAVDKHRAVVLVEEFIQCNRESPLQIHLGQGISRGEKMDFTVQKAVELGVNTITPLFTEYCNVKLEGERLTNRLRHWQGIAISAAEQSGRCSIAKVLPAQTLEDWALKAAGLCLILDPSSAANKLSSIRARPSFVTLLVGSEGGLSDKEILFAKQNKFLPTRLGSRILRTETAALAAISVLQAQWGDF
ncbi:Ribosomal RNA small subunit methyltransferase E [Gammaproteobacteria bacterium]